MQKTLNQVPGSTQDIKADLVLEINMNHPVASKLKNLFTNDKEKFVKYSKLLYNNARLVSGLPIESPAEFSKLISELLSE